MSQPDLITIPVDELNTGVDTDHVYSRFDDFANRSVYINTSTHNLEMRDTLGLYRTFPKPNGNFKGVGKTSLKFTTDISVDAVDGVSTLVSPMIGEVGFSIPVGATDAQKLILRQRIVALVDQELYMVPLQNQLEI
jgi:hypothetical protein